MRLYEAASARIFDEVTLDKLTIDTYASTLRRERAGQRLSSRDMFAECWWSNLITYMADYSVHQVILAYGYYVYVQGQRRRLTSQNENEVKNARAVLHPGSLLLSFTKKVRRSFRALIQFLYLYTISYCLTLLHALQSVSLWFTRAVGLFFASIGGAIGTSFMPGWGTIIGINMGDGIAISFTDEIVTT